MNKILYQLIAQYHPVNDQERQDQKVMLEYIATFDDITTRANHFAHFTASPWIINQDGTKVLMIYHTIYQSWAWCGGHLDGDDRCLHVALKEGKEETGLTSLQPLSKDPLAIDILPVSPHIKHGSFVSSHLHLNVTYLCIADDQAPLRIKPDENSGVKWIAIEQIAQEVSEPEMKLVYAKLLSSSKKFLLHV